MKVFSSLILFALLSGPAAGQFSPAPAGAPGAAPQASTGPSPVERVVQLLEELQANLQKDQKVEQQIYDRYACWCELTTGRKAAAIHMANSRVVQLSQDVLELKGEVAVLGKEIADITALIAENEETQKSATAVRKEENGAWQAEKAELEEAINALERAIKVLSGAGTKTSLLQGSSAASEAKRKQALNSVLLALPASANMDPKQLAAIQSFAMQSFTPTAADASSSNAPQSATVQGILKDMYDTFTSDLEGQTVTEAKKQRDFEDLIATLVSELNSMNEVVLKKEAEKAAAQQELADTLQELDDTKAQMEADIEFFDLTKAGCLAKKEEWDTRKEARIEEIAGIKKALEILTGDEARALFHKAIKPGMETSFLQIDSDSSQARAANKAYEALKAQARKSHSLRLAALAATVRSTGVGHFEGVIKEIDKIIADLKLEETADMKQRDWCKDEYQENSEEKAELKWLIKNNDAMITKLQNKIDKLLEDIAQTVEEIEATKAQIEQMKAERKAENDEFKQAKTDDEMAIQLLTKTVEVLSSYHTKHKTGMGPIQGAGRFLQEPEFEVSADQAPEAKFADKGSRKNESKGILSILTMLIEDLQSEIENGIKDEVAAQAEYEKELAAAEKLVVDLTEKRDNLREQEAQTQTKKGAEEDDKATNEKSLLTNENYLQGPEGIKPDCDWMLNSFEERREKRKAEMNGLVTAKEYLQGAAPPAMLQTGASFDDTKLEQIGFISLHQ